MVWFGMPAFFITVSSAAVHAPVLLQLAGVEISLDNIISVIDLPSPLERAKIVACDPVAAANYFNIVIDAFTSYLLGFKQPGGGIFGNIGAYFGCIEEQGTGTLHIHMLTWLQGFKSKSELELKLKEDSFRNDLRKYLEDVIKQGFLSDVGVNDDVNVPEVSCKGPVNPAADDFHTKLAEDVNKLVKMANTHRHTFTCYKYKNVDQCRFGFPRELYPDTFIKEDEIFLKRTSPVINNYNPILVTCVRSNHDIKFIPSSKDGKSCAFCMTDYATKSSLSSHQMAPLIAASMKKIESSNSKLDDVVLRSKSLITKCLNRITTETEMSGSHICHFLMGHSDKKASHSFVCLNLHTALCWVTEEISKDDNMDDSESDVLALEGNEHDDAGYTIEHGNTGLVVTNQFTDYRNRGKDLTDMSLHEYCSNVYKKTLTDDEK